MNSHSEVWIVHFERYPSVVVCSSKVLALAYVAEKINGAVVTGKREYNQGNLVEINYKTEFGQRLGVSVYSTPVDPHVKKETTR